MWTEVRGTITIPAEGFLVSQAFHTHYLICSAQLPGEEERLGIVMFHWMHQETSSEGQASQRTRSHSERQSGQLEENPPLLVTVTYCKRSS